jgi:hypothetical protein
VLKVLQQLPEGLAIAVLAASPADLEHHLSILPASLQPLAIEAAFPFIKRDQSLTLDFFSSSCKLSSTPHAVMQAAITATSALQKLHLSRIPVHDNDHLMQLVAAGSKSASDVQLSFGRRIREYGHEWHSFAQVAEALASNTGLISLRLAFYCDEP